MISSCCEVVLTLNLELSQCLTRCQQTGAQEAVRDHGQDRWPELAKVVFHTLEHDA